MSTLKMVDDLVTAIDNGKKFFTLLGSSLGESFRLAKITDRALSYELMQSPKFILPTLGQFYRPIEELVELSTGKFYMYGEAYEIDMLCYPPFPKFVLLFKGYDEQLRIVTKTMNDVSFSDFIILCKMITPNAIAMKPFYFNERAMDVDGRVKVPIGWATMGLTINVKYIPPDDRVPGPFRGYGVVFDAIEEYTWELDKLQNFVSSMWVEIRALLQFLVVLNVRRGVERSERTTPVRTVARTGRRLGFSYHVLNIDPNYAAPGNAGLGGTHASPRFHLRRAHLRHFQDGRMTFVKQAYVGDPILGKVGKDYRIK